VNAGELYHEAMVRLAREARGAGQLDEPDGSATLDNPLCGDRITFQVQLRRGRIAGLAHRVRGCLLCEASASLLGRCAVGLTPADVEEGRAALAALLQSRAPPPPGPWTGLSVFTPVAAVASRHGCALLPFDTLREALAIVPR
jgi:nitrogen fixation NifU-like protein